MSTVIVPCGEWNELKALVHAAKLKIGLTYFIRLSEDDDTHRGVHDEGDITGEIAGTFLGYMSDYEEESVELVFSSGTLLLGGREADAVLTAAHADGSSPYINVETLVITEEYSLET